ncbi:hypothetical protein JW979_14665 [bacterium]|nr:hypothetical protein [candidate division CSSED10-310 bacterium]
MIFTGIYKVQPDKLNRIVLPKSFRKFILEAGEILYVRPAENYFIAAPEISLQNLLEHTAPGRPDDEIIREKRRRILASVKQLHMDPQGRIKITFMTEMNESSLLMLVGTGGDFEIWDRTLFVNTYPDLEGDE